MATRMPVLFVPHGGGPYSYVDFAGADPNEVEALAGYWRSVGELSAERPRALLVVSAHWETEVPTVMTAPQPPMLFDYYGFPPASYELSWPAPGEPALAARVRGLLQGAGFETAEDAERGFDHGTFVPLGRSFPDADVPTVQLSLEASLDPGRHLAIGRALAPLRDEGVLIVGSGMSYHNMRGFRLEAATAVADGFDAWLQETVRLAPAERDAALTRWDRAPRAREVHPREEHLLPLMVVAGAAGEDPGQVPWTGPVFGKTVSAVQFG
ncbi:MAG: class III extradiol ring-cleavage dioxygenase [Myxococcota bacterium]